MIYTKEFRKVLEEIDSKISIDLLNNNVKNKDFNFIDIKDENHITFLRNKIFDDVWSHKKRQPIKIGRFIKKAFANEYNSEQIENFVYEYKSILRSKDLTFKLIEGDDIVRWYSDESYKDICGSLGRSCMRFKRCQRFFDIYTKNPEKIKLLILIDKNMKLVGRALVWFLDKPHRIFMDKVYVNYRSDYNLFLKYAKRRGWLFGYKRTMVVSVKNRNYDFYPYVDTMFNYDPERNILTNSTKYLRKIGTEKYYNLSCIFGDYDLIRIT